MNLNILEDIVFEKIIRSYELVKCIIIYFVAQEYMHNALWLSKFFRGGDQRHGALASRYRHEAGAAGVLNRNHGSAVGERHHNIVVPELGEAGDQGRLPSARREAHHFSRAIPKIHEDAAIGRRIHEKDVAGHGEEILGWAVHPEAYPEPPADTILRVER